MGDESGKVKRKAVVEDGPEKKPKLEASMTFEVQPEVEVRKICIDKIRVLIMPRTSREKPCGGRCRITSDEVFITRNWWISSKRLRNIMMNTCA